MKEFKYVITDAEGIHARPAGELVKAAKEFSSKITINAPQCCSDLTPDNDSYMHPINLCHEKPI